MIFFTVFWLFNHSLGREMWVQSVKYPSAVECKLSKANGYFKCIPISRFRFKLWFESTIQESCKKVQTSFLLELFSKIKIFLIFLAFDLCFFSICKMGNVILAFHKEVL